MLWTPCQSKRTVEDDAETANMSEVTIANSATVTFEQRQGVGVITFNRPPANAYEVGFHRQFNDAIEAADKDTETRVVLIRSAIPRFFCAGADIKVFAANPAEANKQMVDAARAALGKIEASGKPFIACIEGHALGGGLEIAMACDLRLAKRGNYKLGLPEVQLGLIPGNGGSQRLARIVGASRAYELLVSGESFGPEEAYRIGLVNALIEPDEFQGRSSAWAQRLAKGAPLALAATKRAVREGIEMTLADGLKLETKLVDQLYETRDAREGFNAAVEKRPPVYQGK